MMVVRLSTAFFCLSFISKVFHLLYGFCVSFIFELTGEMADVFSPDDVYISGINPVIVMGADALPGDWGIKGMEITEVDSDYVVDDTDAEAVEEVEDLGDE